MNLSFVGVIICFFGSFLGALGDKYVHDSYSKDLNGNYIIQKKKLWLLGILLSVFIDSCFTIIALYFTSAALVTPFAGVHILWNLIITNICLKIRTKLHQYMGSLFLICGITVIITFSEKKVYINNMDDLINMYSQIKVIIYIVVIFTIIIILLFMCLIPLCFQNMNNIKCLKKLKYLYTEKFLTNSNINQYENHENHEKHENNSFYCDNVYKCTNVTDSLEKENTYDASSANISGNNIRGNNNNHANSNSNNNNHGVSNNEQNVATTTENFSSFLKSNNKTNLNIELSQDTLEKVRLISKNNSVIIDKKEIYINLMNSYYSRDPISKISQKRLFSSSSRKFKRHDSAKSTKKKNICKNNAKDNKTITKHKSNQRDSIYHTSINKKNAKSKKYTNFFSLLRNKINKNMHIKTESSLQDCYLFKSNSNIEIDQDKQIKIDVTEYNNDHLLPFKDPQYINYDTIIQREKLKKNEKSQEPLFYLHNQDIADANIIEVYDEHNVIRMQYNANSDINAYHKNGIVRKKDNEENIQVNKLVNYVSDDAFPLNVYVKKHGIPLDSVINEDIKNANYSDNDDTKNSVIVIDEGTNYNDVSNNNNSRNDNRDNNKDRNNKNDTINMYNSTSNVDNQFQYMSFITTIYLTPQKKKKTYTDTIYYSIYCSSLCGISGGLVNIFFEQIIGIFSHEKFYIFEYFFSYILIFLALFCLSNQLFFLNVALAHFSVTSVIPLIMSNIVFFSSLTTIIMQDKGSKIHALNLISFSLGVLLVIVGILYLQYDINEIIVKYAKKKKI